MLYGDSGSLERQELALKLFFRLVIFFDHFDAASTPGMKNDVSPVPTPFLCFFLILFLSLFYFFLLFLLVI
jgi:hypothetical protein